MITESIRSVGVLVPAIARPLEDGSFELISGHRRKHACEVVGLSTLPVIVRDVDQDTATVMMVDSNFQREEILPSERAKAYKMKLEAIKRQGARTDLTSDQVGQKSERKSSRDLIAENSPDSSSQIQRYLRLNELKPELLKMVDEGKIALTPAAELTPAFSSSGTNSTISSIRQLRAAQIFPRTSVDTFSSLPILAIAFVEIPAIVIKSFFINLRSIINFQRRL